MRLIIQAKVEGIDTSEELFDLLLDFKGEVLMWLLSVANVEPEEVIDERGKREVKYTLSMQAVRKLAMFMESVSAGNPFTSPTAPYLLTALP